MDTKVQAVINHFAASGRVCCYACAIEFLDPGGVDFVRYLLERNLTIHQITRDPELFQYLHKFGKETTENLQACRRALIQTNHPSQVAVVHRGYYQPPYLTVRYRFGDFQIQMGQIRKGQVLEIFRWDDKCDVTDNIIKTLKNDFSDTVERSVNFRNLPNVQFDQYIHFCYRTGSQIVGFPSYNFHKATMCTPEAWTSSPMIHQVNTLYQVLRNTKRASLFIFEGIVNPDGRLTTVSTWVDVVKRIFEDLANVTIVFIIDYTGFSFPNTSDKLAARRISNLYNTPELNAKILWLDTTSTQWQDVDVPKYGEHPEHAKNMNLNVRWFEDGCI